MLSKHTCWYGHSSEGRCGISLSECLLEQLQIQTCNVLHLHTSRYLKLIIIKFIKWIHLNLWSAVPINILYMQEFYWENKSLFKYMFCHVSVSGRLKFVANEQDFHTIVNTGTCILMMTLKHKCLTKYRHTGRNYYDQFSTISFTNYIIGTCSF